MKQKRKYTKNPLLNVAKRYIKSNHIKPYASKTKQYNVFIAFAPAEGAEEVREFLDALRTAGSNKVSSRFLKDTILKAVRDMTASVEG
jgi:hypothetical protein